MGYSTEFTGAFELSRELKRGERQEIFDFCEARHCEPQNANKQANYAPSLYCDWTTDGSVLKWNGCEKSYEMDKWLPILIERFFKPWGVLVNGKVFAQGDRRNDQWVLECVDNKVTRKNISLAEIIGVSGV